MKKSTFYLGINVVDVSIGMQSVERLRKLKIKIDVPYLNKYKIKIINNKILFNNESVYNFSDLICAEEIFQQTFVTVVQQVIYRIAF